MMSYCNQRIKVLVDDILQSLQELSYEVQRQERIIAELRAQIPGGDTQGCAPELTSRPAAVRRPTEPSCGAPGCAPELTSRPAAVLPAA